MSDVEATGRTMRASDLDEDEFLHLALRTIQTNHHEEAISLLKRMLAAFPGNANGYYLLGAEHAQIGLYDRALADFTEALNLQPRLAPARFQLGLLYLTLGRAPEAEAAWALLDQLPADHHLRLFKSALVHLIHDELKECVRGLHAGIDRNKGNPALNEDMKRLLVDVERRCGDGRADNGSAAAPLTHVPQPSSGMVLNAYDQNRDGKAAD